MGLKKDSKNHSKTPQLIQINTEQIFTKISQYESIRRISWLDWVYSVSALYCGFMKERNSWQSDAYSSAPISCKILKSVYDLKQLYI